MKKQFIGVLGLMAVIAITIVMSTSQANTNPTGTPEWLLQRAGSKVSIDKLGEVHLDARSGKTFTLGAGTSLAYSSTNYSGTSSFQPIGVDLNLAAAAGGTTGKFISPIMGNLIGNNQTKAGNYYGGLIGHYNIAGTNATTYPSGAVLAGIGDGTTTAKCAVCAYIDGDSALTTAGAAFKVMSNNSTANSKFAYGVDLADASHDGYNAVSYSTADIRFSSGATLTPVSTTGSVNFDAWSGGDCQTKTVAIAGAADGNPVEVGIPDALASVADVIWSKPWVSAAGVVSLRGCKLTAGASADPAAATVRVTVLKP